MTKSLFWGHSQRQGQQRRSPWARCPPTGIYAGITNRGLPSPNKRPGLRILAAPCSTRTPSARAGTPGDICLRSVLARSQGCNRYHRDGVASAPNTYRFQFWRRKRGERSGSGGDSLPGLYMTALWLVHPHGAGRGVISLLHGELIPSLSAPPCGQNRSVLPEVASRGDPTLNPQLGRSWLVPTARACTLLSERLTFALGEPCPLFLCI